MLARLSDFRAWFPWRLELDGKPCLEWPADPNIKPQKVPYRVDGEGRLTGAYGDDGSYNPEVRGPFAEAQKAAEVLLRGGAIGGVGVAMGPVPDNPELSIGGLDFDSCRNAATGEFDPWARAFLDDMELDTYAEVSPSGTGAKAYFTYPTADLPKLRAAFGSWKRKWERPKQPGMRHAPAIEPFLGKGWFAYTGQKLPDAPDDALRVSVPRLIRLARVDGPAFDGGKPSSPVVQSEPVDDDDDDDLRGDPDWPRIDKSLEALPVSFRDDRDNWLMTGAALHHESGGGEDGFTRWDEWSQPSEKYDAKDQRRVWESFKGSTNKPVTIATLYREAKKYRPKPTSGRLSFHSPSDCEAAPPRGYVVKGMIAPRDLGCTFGVPGAGKSLISPRIGYAVAQGKPVFGMRTRPGVVFYVAAEDPSGMQGRVRALKLAHGDAPNFVLVSGVSDLLSEDSDDLQALKAAVADRKPVLIFLDTLAMSFPGLEENTAEGMGRVVKVARELTEHGAAVVLIHHSPKEGSTPRGHGLLDGALDVSLELKAKDEQGIIRGTLKKNRNGTTERDIAFRIDVREFGLDDDGDPIDAALCAELPPGTAPRVEPLADSERHALRILGEMIAEDDGNSVSETAWRKRCIEGHEVSAAPNRDSRRTAVTRAVSGLVRKSRISISDERVAVRGAAGRKHDNPDLDHGFDDE